MKYECHGHIILDGIDYKKAMDRHKSGPDKSFIRKNLMICKEHGILFYRDGGDKYLASAYAKEIAGEYGIDYRTPIYAIFKKGGYGSMFGRAFESINELKELILEAKALGADFIKLMVSGLMDFNTDGSVTGPALCEAEVNEAVNIASGEGLHVMAHVNGTLNIKNALCAGVKSIEHGFWPDREVIDIFLQTGAVWVPTRAPVQNLRSSGRFKDAVLDDILETQGRILIEAYKRGVLIASGSDSGSFMVMPGRGTDEEYGYLSDLGIDPISGNRLISDIFKR